MSRNRITYSENPNHAARSAHAKGDKAFRTYDTSYIRPKRNPMPAVVGLIVLIVALALIVWGVMSWVNGCSRNEMLPEGQQVEVVVEEGEGAKSVAKTLYELGLIDNRNEFVDQVTALGDAGQLHPGTYTLTGGMSTEEIIAILQTPVAVENTFTVPEGSTLQQTAEIVAEASGGSITVEDFVAAASDASVYAPSFSFLNDAGTNSLEGFLYPKTYPITSEDTADSIIRAMLNQFSVEVTSLDWTYPRESLGLSFYDVMKVASMVERETDTEYRATVAQVFYNRMAWGMLLQSDATLAYVLGREPTPEELLGDDPYNTYTQVGLPPTPICSPSLGCIEAACQPDFSEYFYFYIAPDDSGVVQHYFAATLDEHEANIAAANS